MYTNDCETIITRHTNNQVILTCQLVSFHCILLEKILKITS